MARMTKDAFAYFDGERGYLTTVDGEGAVTEIMTVKASPGRVIHIDDGKDLPMMRFGGGRYGPVLKWSSDARTMGERFARDCRATLLPTRAAYDRAVAKARAL
ncbi:hypothetical protein SAMN05444161_9209 [Rhizobiales bacterium GAS191]|nr:hypothetical protein SAMN05444161_9209 [Rhizobiales bacterium GAS191]